MADKQVCQPGSHARQIVLRSGRGATSRKVGQRTLLFNGAVTPDVSADNDEANSRQIRIQLSAEWRSSGLWDRSGARWGLGYGNGPIRPAKVSSDYQNRSRPKVFPVENFGPTVDTYIPFSSKMRFECRM